MVYTSAKICTFCKTEIKEVDTEISCPSCGALYHQKCWEENNGCVTVGCTENYREKAAMPTVKYCKNCGAGLENGQPFCPKCGQKTEPIPTNTWVSSEINQCNSTQPNNSGNKNNILIPIIIGIAFVAVAILYFLLRTPSVDEIALSESAIEIKVNTSQTVTYTISPKEADDNKVVWKSSNELVATVDDNGVITGISEGLCDIIVIADGKKDSLKVTVIDGPDFKELYDEYCSSTWASVGSDGSFLSIDTNPYDIDDKGVAYIEAYYAIKKVNSALGLPESWLEEMNSTTSLMGRQTEEYEDVTVSWSYHPDKGLELTYKKN